MIFTYYVKSVHPILQPKSEIKINVNENGFHTLHSIRKNQWRKRFQMKRWQNIIFKPTHIPNS